MVALHDKTEALVMFSILDGAAVLFVKNIGGYDPYGQIPQVGEHCSIHACAAGKVLVAFRREDMRAKILSATTLTRFTEHIARYLADPGWVLLTAVVVISIGHCVRVHFYCGVHYGNTHNEKHYIER